MSSPSQRENSRSSSISSSSGEENSPCKSADEPETIEYIPVELDAVESHMSSQDLESEDVELWLVQVPRHDTLLSSLKGSRIKIPKSENKSSAKGQAFNKKLGVFKGSYMFRDRGLEGQKNLRAVFVDKDEEGKPSLNVAKPFAKSVSVTFDTALTFLGNEKPPPRVYPVQPTGMKLKYCPIGSSRGKVKGKEEPVIKLEPAIHPPAS